MVVIDGSQGEGGGQVFRSSLTLSMCLGKPFQIHSIRAGRKKPGLLRQHLTCLRAAQQVSEAEVTGDELGSTDVTFVPGKVRAGQYRFSIGSAGSTSLVFQTILLPLLLAGGVSDIELEGGTHNGYAPSFDYINHCFLPTIEKLGYKVDVKLKRFGFYPAGGGAWCARVYSANTVLPLNLMNRGQVVQQMAMATSSLVPEHINERELAQVKKKCHWSDDALHQRMVKSEGPGNILSLRVFSEHCAEVVEIVGQKQVTAERVTGRAIKSLNQYLNADVPVGKYLADQLLLPMALGKGGHFRTLPPSQHCLTNAEVIRQFMGVGIRFVEESCRVWLVCVGGRNDG